MDNHDKKNFELLDNVIQENHIIVDVGANMGQYTDFFKNKLNGTGKIYTIELFPQTCKTLNLRYYNEKNITVLNYAVSNIDGKVPFYSGNHHCLHNILGHDVSYRETQFAGEIESIRLDTLLKGEKNIDLIKIDVEGAELMVLEGCKNILDRIQHILVECHLSKDWDKIKKILLEDYNFECVNNSGDVNGLVVINNESEIAYQCFCKKK
jgi:FkbM family methyltransferase